MSRTATQFYSFKTIRGVTVLVNNAAKNLSYCTNQEPNRDDLLEIFNTNAAGATVLTQTFLPLLRKAASQIFTDEFSFNRAAIINISSTLGSLEKNRVGSGPNEDLLAYRMSKSAGMTIASGVPVVGTSVHGYGRRDDMLMCN
ncbi:unnamed protein product [Strongylus vulgaris]|uniref:Uncharacterized protein n=1 Tax=Strongylus vulgaris TaxID=40348 RepID=A0A3P7I176_STRVU|nr:unnamed protein product [Strongylus vulgaris]